MTFDSKVKCSKCQQWLPPEAFAQNRSMRSGRQAYCRHCSADYYRQRREARGFRVRPRVEVPPGHKRCADCGEIKPHGEWNINRRQPSGLGAYCRACTAVRNRESHFRRHYGMSQADHTAMLKRQFGMCLICLSAKAEHVDHDHETGKVRGILCFACNAALGQFKDRPDVLRRAADYLEGNRWKPTLVAPGVYRLPS